MNTRPDLIRWLAVGTTVFALMVGLSVLALLLFQTLPILRHEGLDYLMGSLWHYRGERFGVLAMVYGTLVVAGVALSLATPFALGAALFTAEVVPLRYRMWIKVPIELLAGIPSVVYGLLGVLLFRNWIYHLFRSFDPLSGDTLLTAGVLLGIMILPTIMTLSDDALRGVPATQRKAARGLGLTLTETVFRISLPQALPGLVAAVLLGLGRALGETIAVFLVVGRQDNRLPESLLSLKPLLGAGQTLTSKLGGSETFIAYGNPVHWAAMVGLSLVLLVLVVGLSLVGDRFAGARSRRA